jgi:hypothetical protein
VVEEQGAWPTAMGGARGQGDRGPVAARADDVASTRQGPQSG